MNKAESKYLNTSSLMNQALIELLNNKDYEFINVKEICKKAGVNRSTFYLHYDTIDDLLEETLENINKKFVECFNVTGQEFVSKINSCALNELILITRDYLIPYLKFIKENKTIYQVAIKKPMVMESYQKYNQLSTYVLKPIFSRFGISSNKQQYEIAYYINGVNAIISEWIKNGFKEDVDTIIQIIEECVRPYLH